MLNTYFEQVYREQVLDPQDNTGNGAATVPASYIDVSDFERFVFEIELGNNDGTLDAQVVQATDAAGTGSKNVAGAVITQLGATDDNKQVSIEVQTAHLDINNDFHFVAITLTEAGSTAQLLSCVFKGVNPGIAPVTQPVAYSQQVIVAG